MIPVSPEPVAGPPRRPLVLAVAAIAGTGALCLWNPVAEAVESPETKATRLAEADRVAQVARKLQEEAKRVEAKSIERKDLTLTKVVAEVRRQVEEMQKLPPSREIAMTKLNKLADHFYEESIEEMKHAEEVIDRILYLDGIPDIVERRYSLDLLDPRDATADPDNDGVSNLQELRDGTHPNGLVTRYLAEGATSTFFTTTLAMTNPGEVDATVLLRFLPASGAPIPHLVTVPAYSRQTVDVGSVAGLANAEFSTVLESDQLVVLDRLMSWDANGYGSTSETAIPSLSTEWFLACLLYTSPSPRD